MTLLVRIAVEGSDRSCVDRSPPFMKTPCSSGKTSMAPAGTKPCPVSASIYFYLWGHQESNRSYPAAMGPKLLQVRLSHGSQEPDH